MKTDGSLLFISESDYKFIHALPDDEKILCLFDVWLSDSTELPDTMPSFEELIDMSIINPDTANIVITPNMAVINGESYKLVKDAVSHLFSYGFVLERIIISNNRLRDTFQRQKYCLVYSIKGVVNPISAN